VIRLLNPGLDRRTLRAVTREEPLDEPEKNTQASGHELSERVHHVWVVPMISRATDFFDALYRVINEGR